MVKYWPGPAQVGPWPSKGDVMKQCMNCGDHVYGRPSSSGRGPDIAWFIHCRPCADLVEDQMQVIADRPHGRPIQILRCRNCGVERSCRPGWRTRCHVCIDKRTDNVPALDVGRELVARSLRPDVEFVELARKLSTTSTQRELTTSAATANANFLALQERLALHTKVGWTILAGDVRGLPWTAERDGTASHGTWGQHDDCGNIQKIPLGRVECEVCGPDTDSRTHWARRDEPYLLYLVRYGNIQKFGCGDARRVQAHLNHGAEVVQVLENTHEKVVAAELVLKRRYREHTLSSSKTPMPRTFGTGSEVVPIESKIDLCDVLGHSHDMIQLNGEWG